MGHIAATSAVAAAGTISHRPQRIETGSTTGGTSRMKAATKRRLPRFAMYWRSSPNPGR